MTRGQGLNSKFSTVVRHGGDLRPRRRRFSPSGFFFCYGGCVLADRSSPSPLEWLPFPHLVAAVLITFKGAESPGSGRIGVIGALVFFSI